MLNESGSIMIESKRATVMENKGNVYVCHLEGLNKNVIAHDSSPKQIVSNECMVKILKEMKKRRYLCGKEERF